jgi:regulator of protease activity HflC (stomatin/prohibitin superfamily)
MFDKLIDVLLNFIGLAKFWVIISPAKEAVVCTWGKETRRIDNKNGWFGTGFHLKAPLDIEEVYDLSLATRLAELQAQTLVTKDGKAIATGIIVTYRVHDISKAIFSVWDAFSAAQDACQANFAQAVQTTNYDDIRTPAFTDKLTEVCRKQGFKYGFEIESVRIHEFAPTRTFRLIGDGIPARD